ncbi:MAG: hypothetical protein WB999_13715 [Candidatus Binataceae bacterium]
MSEEAHAAADVVRWMLKEGRDNTHMREFGDEMCRRIVAAGIPLWRGFYAVSTLGTNVVTSASFAAAVTEPLRSLGLHRLRGVSQPQEVFTLQP